MLKCDYLKYAPWPNARACLDKLIYVFIDLANTSQLTYGFCYREGQRCLWAAVLDSEDHLEGEGCVIGDKEPVSWDRRALLGVRSPTTSTSSRGYWAGWT